MQIIDTVFKGNLVRFYLGEAGADHSGNRWEQVRKYLIV